MEEKKQSTYNEQHNKYTQEYIRQNYRQLSIRLPKEGEVTREKIAQAAQKAGMSTNAYIVEAVRERMQIVDEGFTQDVDETPGDVVK